MHLYLHVPFCVRRCSYCDFAIAVRRVVPADRFVAAVLAERACRADAETWGRGPWETVYLGGGTPSRLPPDAVARLLEAFPRAPGAEVTLEANPEDVTPAGAAAWRAAGVTRVSLGAQSFDPKVLRWMHRAHAPEAAGRALACVRDAAIPQVSLDLMFALPEELAHDVPRDLDRALELGPDHVSAYGLTLESRTPYARWVSRRHTTPAADDRYAAEFLLVHRRLTAAGFEHYEVSNYARLGPTGSPRRARHNAAYWSGRAYVGLGPAAHGYAAGRRRWNVREWSAYERAVLAGRDPVAGEEELTAAQGLLEAVYLGLRSITGLDPESVARLSQSGVLAAIKAGWLTKPGDRLQPTVQGWLVLDGLVGALTTLPKGG